MEHKAILVPAVAPDLAGCGIAAAQESARFFAIPDRAVGGHLDAPRTRLGQKYDDGEKNLSQSMRSLELRMTVKLGSLWMLGFGLAITALRLWT